MKLRLTELILKAFDGGYQEYPKLTAGYDGKAGFWVEVADPQSHLMHAGSGATLAGALADLETRIKGDK